MGSHFINGAWKGAGSGAENLELENGFGALTQETISKQFECPAMCVLSLTSMAMHFKWADSILSVVA